MNNKNTDKCQPLLISLVAIIAIIATVVILFETRLNVRVDTKLGTY